MTNPTDETKDDALRHDSDRRSRAAEQSAAKLSLRLARSPVAGVAATMQIALRISVRLFSKLTDVGNALVSDDFGRIVRSPAVLIPVFGLVWWAYWTISQSAASLYPDMTEAYSWGREFQLGYWKHPPFWAWVCGAWFLVFPRTGATFALLSAANTTIGLWGVWRLVGLFARREKRIAATAMFLLTPFPTFWAYKYNANSIFLSVWPWTLFFFVRAYQRRRLVDSLGLGAMVAAALLCKYYALILCATIGLAALSRPERNAYLRSPSPYVSAATAGFLILPYLSWLWVNRAPPLGYLESVSGLGTITTLYNVQKVVFGAIVELSVPAAIIAYYDRDGLRDLPGRARARWADPTYRFLTILNFAPLGLTLAAGLVMQVKLDNYMLRACQESIALIGGIDGAIA